MTEGEILEKLTEDVVEGNKESAIAHVEDLLRMKVDPKSILDRALAPSMEVVGRKFERGDFFLSEMMASAVTMQSALEKLRPLMVASMAKSGSKPMESVVIGTVSGDVHDIGKNIVAVMLEGAGFRVVDLGYDVAAHKFATTARTERAGFVAVSALLTTTMLGMSDVVRALESEGIRKDIEVMVGGAPLTENFARKIGADIYAKDAFEGVAKARAAVAGETGK